VYASLRREGDIVERVAPPTIRDVYLREKPFVFTEQLIRFNATTLGEPHIAHRSGWEEGIRLGVEEGIFGLGLMKRQEPICLYFRQTPSYVELSGNEVLVRQDLCEAQQKREEAQLRVAEAPQEPEEAGEVEEKSPVQSVSERFEAKLHEHKHSEIVRETFLDEREEEAEKPVDTQEPLSRKEAVAAPPTVVEPPVQEAKETLKEEPSPEPPVITSAVISPRKGARQRSGSRKEIHLRFDVPQGNVTDLMSVIYSLRHKYKKITLEIHAEQGGMTAHEYQMNVQEILRDMGVFVEEAEM
jgi:hypothetical protein